MFDSLPDKNHGQKCKTCSILESLNDDDRAALMGAISNPEMSAQMIVDVLKRVDISVSISALSRHRRVCR